MAKKRSPQLVAIRLARRTIRGMEPRMKALIAEYVRAEAQLKSLVARHILAGDFHHARVRAQIARETKRAMALLDQAAIPDARELVADAYEAGVRIAGEQGHSTIEQEAIDLLQDNIEGRLTDATRTVGRRVDDIFRRESLRFAAVQVSDEHELPELTRKFAQRVEKEGVTSFVDKAGRRWGLESYAEMAIRTTVSEARTRGTETTLIARGFDLVEVHNPTGGCDTCRPYIGRTYSLTGRADGYPVLEPAPPFHGRCNCFIAPSKLAAEERRAA